MTRYALDKPVRIGFACEQCLHLVRFGPVCQRTQTDDRIIGQPAKFCKDAPIIHIEAVPGGDGLLRVPYHCVEAISTDG